MEIIKKETSIAMVDGKALEITISDEHAKELYNGIRANQTKGIDLYLDNCEKLAELRNTNGYFALGYETPKALYEELFEAGETQGKNMCLIAQNYGKHNEDGSYTIIDKDVVKQFSATQLIEIKGLKNFKQGKLAEAVEFYGFTGDFTCGQLRALKQAEKAHGKALTVAEFAELKQAIETKTDTAKAETKTDTAKAETKTDSAKAETKQVKELEKELATTTSDKERLERLYNPLNDMLGELQKLVTNKKISDKDFRDKVTTLVMNLGK